MGEDEHKNETLPTDGVPGIEVDEFWQAEFARTGNPPLCFGSAEFVPRLRMWAAHNGVPGILPQYRYGASSIYQMSHHAFAI
jgi:hypothetical protein